MACQNAGETHKKPTAPYIKTFRLQAERMNELGIPLDPDAAMLLLSHFMAHIAGNISEEEMFSLAEIEAHIFRKELHR